MQEREFRQMAQRLVDEMTVEEAASQLLHHSPAIPRLGVQDYNWWSEALHGVARAGIATVFPQAIGMAASFDPDFLKKEAEIIADEARAKHNAAMEAGDTDIYKGLTFWSPNINIFRDPRWGRGQETYGEDPYLTTRLGNAFIEGLQGDMSEHKYMKIAACAKHFAVHSGPEALRHEFDARPTEKDLFETYLPAFRSAVQDAGVEAVMGAYNSINGEPACANERLLVDILRGEWGFDGHVVSDCWAVRDFHEHHGFTSRPAESASTAVKRGCDLNCGCTYEALMTAYGEGLITEEEIKAAAVHVFTTRFKLGMFADDCEYDKIPFSVVHCPEHIDMALKAAEESIVLLKNDGILPLKKEEVKNVAVIGPNAYSIKALFGNYNGDSDNWITCLDGIRDYLAGSARVYYSQGCDIIDEKEDPLARPGKYISEALACIKMSDVVILSVGLNGDLEGEEGDTGNAFASGDKVGLLLPDSQRKLVEAVLAANKPVILVVQAGSALDLSAYEEKAAAILQAWYPGEAGGLALAKIIFGEVSPSGRLPLTFYHDDDELPDFTDYSMKGRSYKFFRGTPWYAFGYGLSYADFAYTGLQVTMSEEECILEAELTNKSDFAADEVTEVYLSYLGEAYEKPIRKLAGFCRTHLEGGETRHLCISVPLGEFSSVLSDGSEKLLSGSYRISLGSSQPDERSVSLLGRAPLQAEIVI